MHELWTKECKSKDMHCAGMAIWVSPNKNTKQTDTHVLHTEACNQTMKWTIQTSLQTSNLPNWRSCKTKMETRMNLWILDLAVSIAVVAVCCCCFCCCGCCCRRCSCCCSWWWWWWWRWRWWCWWLLWLVVVVLLVLFWSCCWWGCWWWFWYVLVARFVLVMYLWCWCWCWWCCAADAASVGADVVRVGVSATSQAQDTPAGLLEADKYEWAFECD